MSLLIIGSTFEKYALILSLLLNKGHLVPCFLVFLTQILMEV